MRALMVIGVAVLAGSTVFADELAHGRRVDHELGIDAAVGVALAATAMFAAVTVLRLMSGQSGMRQREQIAEAIRAGSEASQPAAVYAGLPREGCQVVEASKAVVIAAEAQARGRVAGAYGMDADILGRQVSLDLPATRETLETGRLAVVEGRLVSSLLDAGVESAAIGPLRWGERTHALFLLGRRAGEEPFDERDLQLLDHVCRLASLALEQASLRAELERAAEAGVDALAAAVDRRDSYTADHSESVVELAVAVGSRLGLDEPALRDVRVAARLHDVGKIGVPDRILRKPGPLDPDEWAVMRQHPGWGAQMLAKVPELVGVAALVRYEHERWDGGGYPDGLRGDEIPMPSRIVFACDAYHAMTSDRPYRPALSREHALRELEHNAGSQFDPRVVAALRSEIDLGPSDRRAG